jgi:rhamnosyltransferase
MIENSVCAVIVTYHPSAKMLENIPNVLAQVQGLVVVDNGSNVESLGPLRVGAELLGFQLIENGENLGIAEALNQGVLWAKTTSYQWVVLFDQDSCITDGFVDHLLTSWKEHPQRERVVTMVPCYIDPLNGFEIPFHPAKDGGPVVTMTSGSLLPTWIFDRIGLFPSEYFIDYVDFEYSLRARAAGYLIARSSDAILFHTPGNPTPVRLFGISLFCTSNHSAMRHYYMTRNRIAIARKHFRAFPLWTINDLMYTGKEFVKILIGESDKRPKIAAMCKGLIHGITGRMGKM